MISVWRYLVYETLNLKKYYDMKMKPLPLDFHAYKTVLENLYKEQLIV